MSPRLRIAGHIVKDIKADGWTPGGGALYAAAQASKLDVDTVVVTACEWCRRGIDARMVATGAGR